MSLNKLSIGWSGTGLVGPGLTQWYFTGTMAGIPAAAVTLFTALRSLVPSGVTWTIPSAGDVIDEATGELTGQWSVAGGASVASNGTGVFALGVGARCKLNTATVFLGRRITGSFFLVPLTSGQYDAQGTPLASTISAAETAFATFLGAATPNWKVWSRPRPAGQYATAQITSVTMPDAISTLRSRRT